GLRAKARRTPAAIRATPLATQAPLPATQAPLRPLLTPVRTPAPITPLARPIRRAAIARRPRVIKEPRIAPMRIRTTAIARPTLNDAAVVLTRGQKLFVLYSSFFTLH